MTNAPPISCDLWNQMPPDAREAVAVVVGRLEARIADLEARLNQNSSNSSRPPSSDPIGVKRKPPAPRSRRKRGGQPGRRKAVRPLVPPEKLRSSTDCKPTACRRCKRPLVGVDPAPLVHQVAEIPPIEPWVDQYLLHRLTCPGCGESTCGVLPEGVAASRFGPRLQAVLATLAGACRLSKRQVRQLAGDLLGLSISTGMIAKLERRSAMVLAEPHRELADSVREAAVVNVDETGWREQGRRAWLWAATTEKATVFTIAANRSGEIARRLLGDKLDRIVGSDRYSAYNWLAAASRQLCWSHLRRDFQAMIDRGGIGAKFGGRLLGLSNRLFRLRRKARDGLLGEATYRRAIGGLERFVHETLEDGSRCGCARTAGTCSELLRLEAGLWNFARRPGVEPTNNVSERAVRHAVIWRRISGGTQSASGSRFVERMLTVAATCRRQGRNLLDYLTSAVQAHRAALAVPSLLPASNAG
jgi:transposase